MVKQYIVKFKSIMGLTYDEMILIMEEKKGISFNTPEGMVIMCLVYEGSAKQKAYFITQWDWVIEQIPLGIIDFTKHPRVVNIIKKTISGALKDGAIEHNVNVQKSCPFGKGDN